MATNDGISGGPVRDPFPGIPLPAGTGLGGTAGASGRAPDDQPAGPVTPPGGAWQDRPDLRTSGTLQPGQLDEGISGVTAGFTASTGAGDGHTDAWARHDWQQQPGGAS